MKLEKADAKTQGGHAFKTMAAYQQWLGDGGEEGARQLAVLRLMDLFDRPADAGCLAALRRAPAIEGLTEPLVDLDDEDWNFTVADLDEALEIAARGPMPLYQAEIHLHRARLFRDRDALAEARRLIEKHGYGRRLEELADAEARAEAEGW